MKNTLAVSMCAATKIFLSIAASDLSTCEKGQVMSLATQMMENTELVTKEDFSPFAGGEDVFESIALAVRRSRRARAAAAARKKAETLSADIDKTEPTAERPVVERPRKHPRLKIKCRYKTDFSASAIRKYPGRPRNYAPRRQTFKRTRKKS